MTNASPHKTMIKVRYSETDKMGRVYHSHYLVWLDIARTKLLDDAGYSYANMEKEGSFLVVAEANCKYISPAKFDDAIEICTSISNIGRASIDFTYDIKRKPDELLAKGYTKLACIGKDGKPIAIPDKIKSALKL